jgi:hypothetical protein
VSLLAIKLRYFAAGMALVGAVWAFVEACHVAAR